MTVNGNCNERTNAREQYISETDMMMEDNNNDGMSLDDDAIQVVIRVRPLNDKEMLTTCENNTVTVHDCHSLTISDSTLDKQQHREDKVFTFDKCFTSDDEKHPSYASQQDIYDNIGAGIVENAFDGYNCCVFAYGQTGSGKTHT